MVHAKNYETMSTFVIKVMQKKLWPLFFRTRCRTATDALYTVSQNNAQTLKRYSSKL